MAYSFADSEVRARFAVWSLSYGRNSFVMPTSASRGIIIHVPTGSAGRSNRYFQALPEDKMANRAGWKFGASFLVLSLIIGPAAFAAADNAGQESPSQAGQDSKSYLPPWMQGQGSSEKASAPANTAAPAATAAPAPTATAPATTAAPESKSAAASDDDAMKRKVRTGQGRRSHRHGSPADFMSGFVGFFGR